MFHAWVHTTSVDPTPNGRKQSTRVVGAPTMPGVCGGSVRSETTLTTGWAMVQVHCSPVDGFAMRLSLTLSFKETRTVVWALFFDRHTVRPNPNATSNNTSIARRIGDCFKRPSPRDHHPQNDGVTYSIVFHCFDVSSSHDLDQDDVTHPRHFLLKTARDHVSFPLFPFFSAQPPRNRPLAVCAFAKQSSIRPIPAEQCPNGTRPMARESRPACILGATVQWNKTRRGLELGNQTP